jgi:hypothetical protein
MPKKISVVFVHGIHVSDKSFADKMKTQMAHAMPQGYFDYVSSEQAFWADVVRPRQNDYLASVKKEKLFRQSKSREFVIQGL